MTTVTTKKGATNKFPGFPEATFSFIRGIAANNDKAWFDAHRADYEAHYLEPARSFVCAMGAGFARFAKGVHAEPRVNGSIFRINRDIRFSKDKSPYKTHLALWFWQGTGRSRESAGFYFQLTPKALTLGAGQYRFAPDVLAQYRALVGDERTGRPLERAIAAVEAAGSYRVGGSHYKRVPRGYPDDHPRAGLLRHNGLYAFIEMKTPAEACGPAFIDFCLGHYEAMAPIQTWVADLVERGSA